MTATYDPRWLGIAEAWLDDGNVPTATAKRYAPELAQQLHDRAEEFIEDELPQLMDDADEAARDRHIDQQIDEARGK